MLFFQLFNISELKISRKKSVASLYTKKVKKQTKMRLFLINLFTTLQCQRTTIRDRLNFTQAALWRDGMTPNLYRVLRAMDAKMDKSLELK